MPKHETISTKKFVVLIVTLWSFFGPYFPVFGLNIENMDQNVYLDNFPAMNKIIKISL